MRLLLDTHAAVWWWKNDARLPEPARDAIADPAGDVMISAVVAWEIANKFRIGKWHDVGAIVTSFDALVARSQFQPLPVQIAHARVAGSLDGTHRDPFDRLLVAQAMVESLVVVSGDAAMQSLGARVLWSEAFH